MCSVNETTIHLTLYLVSLLVSLLAVSMFQINLYKVYIGLLLVG